MTAYARSAARWWVAGAVLVMLGWSGASWGQEAGRWIGRRVVLPFDAVLREGGIVVDNQKREDRVRGGTRFVHRVYRVEKVDGLWVWVQAEKSVAHGWVESEKVIPYERAVAHYTSKIQSEPENASSYLIRGLILREQERLDLAMADFDAAIRLEPKNEIAWSNRGLGWASRKEYDKAIADYTEAIRLDQKYVAAFCNRGLAFYKKKNYGRALSDYNEAVRMDPRCAWAYDGRGDTWYDKSEYDIAIKNYTQAISVDPKNVTFYNDRGDAWCRKVEFGKALRDYEQAVRVAPRDPDAYRSRAWVWATCRDGAVRDGKKAVESATRACELMDWKDAECLETLAAAYAELGNFDAALKWEMKAMGLVLDAGKKEEMRARLAQFEKKQPYRELRD